MTKLSYLVFITIALVVLSGAVDGQTGTPAPDQENRVELKFDESDNVTTANLKPVLLTSADPNKIELEAFAFFRGRTPMEDRSQINVSFHSTSRKEQFAANRELTFLLDSERLSLGAMRRVRRACTKTPPSGLGCSYWDEILDIFLPPETLVRIVRAKKVDIIVGSRSLSLQDANLEILRNYVRQISPPEQKFQGGPNNSLDRRGGSQ